jgi:hypothetical protein
MVHPFVYMSLFSYLSSAFSSVSARDAARFPGWKSRSWSPPEVVGHINLVDVHGGHSSCGSVTGASRFLIDLVTDMCAPRAVDSSIVRAHQHSATAKHSAQEDRTVLVEHAGAVSNDKSPRCFRDEPGDHALRRSRGGLSTKIHAAVDGRGPPLAILLTPGQAGDAPMMLPLLAHLRVQRTIGRPGTRPGTSLCVSTPTTRPSATVTCTPSSSATSRSVSAGTGHSRRA